MIRICCCCHRVEAAGQWGPATVEVASERLSHGLCPDCYTTVMAEIDAYNSEKCSEKCSEKSLAALAPTSWALVRGGCVPCA